MLLNDLIDRNVKHIELDGKIGTSGINTESLLVIDQNNLRGEFGLQFLLGGFKRCFGVQSDELDSTDVDFVSIVDSV